MHYSVELWSNYNKVYQQFNSHIQGLNDLIVMFTERYKSKLNLAENLKKLSESKNQITTFESLNEGILGFKGDMYNQFNYLSELLLGMKDEIIKPLSSAYKTFCKKIDNNLSETSTINDEYQNSIRQMEIYKNKFHSSVYSAEQSKLKVEYYKKKINSINDSDKNPKNKEIKDNCIINLKKEENRANNYLKEAKNNEIDYITLINNTNILQDEYIEIKKRNINEIQELEEELGEIIKDSLRKFIIFQVAYLRNMQYDVDKKVKILEGINIRNDIQKFINSNKKDTIPPKKFEYIPYTSKLDIKEETKGKPPKQIIPPEISKEVNNFISNVFPSNRFNEIKFLKIKEKVDVEQIASKIFNEEKLNFVDTQEITKLIIKKRARRLLLHEINTLKNKKENETCISDNAYDTINDIFKECLNLVQNDKDFETAKIIINLSKDIFRQINDENDEKICLLSDLKGEKTIKSFEFWKDLINYEIIERMHKEKIANIKNKKEGKININQIVLEIINLYLQNMINFYCKPNCIRQIIETFNDYYHLDEKNIKDINQIIDNYENSANNKNDINIRRNQSERPKSHVNKSPESKSSKEEYRPISGRTGRPKGRGRIK